MTVAAIVLFAFVAGHQLGLNSAGIVALLVAGLGPLVAYKAGRARQRTAHAYMVWKGAPR